VLVVDGKVVAVAERVPAHVVGDGKSTIEELIDQTNLDPNRGEGHDNVPTRIEVDRTSYQLWSGKDTPVNSATTWGSMLLAGNCKLEYRRDCRRPHRGYPENVWLAERAAKIIGLDIAGIDIVTPDISRPSGRWWRNRRSKRGSRISDALPQPGYSQCGRSGAEYAVSSPIVPAAFPFWL